MVFIFSSHSMTSERWRLDNAALKSLNFSTSKKLLQLVHLRFLANSLNLTILFSSGISHWAVSWSFFFFYSLSFSLGKNAMLPDPRNDAVKIFLPFCAWRVGKRANCIWGILGNVLKRAFLIYFLNIVFKISFNSFGKGYVQKEMQPLKRTIIQFVGVGEGGGGIDEAHLLK